MAGRKSNRGPSDIRWERVGRRSKYGATTRAERPKVGAVFGSLTVVVAGETQNGRTECICSCGKAVSITNDTLRRGSGKCFSCAIKPHREVRRKHTDLFTREQYHVWGHRYTGMVRRCYNEKCPEYRNYGGRGITVFNDWRADKRTFFEYVTDLDGWDAIGLDMDRIDNDRGYEPGNIRLVSRKENTRNTRKASTLEYRGEEYRLFEFMEKLLPNWKSQNSLSYHLSRGRSTEWVVEKHDEGRKCARSIKLRT